MPVYIARIGESGLVKIGFATDLRRRMNRLAREEKQRVTLLREIAGDLAAERWLQSAFASCHVQRGARTRDWFRFTPLMLTLQIPATLPSHRHGSGQQRRAVRAITHSAMAVRFEIDRVAGIEALCDMAPGTFVDLIRPIAA